MSSKTSRSDTGRPALKALGTLAVGAAAAVSAYALVARPRLLAWGATEGERQRLLPGDSLVASPRVQSTRAVTIKAAPDEVWPWLVQIGEGRGGFYSYDWLEDLAGLGVQSAERIVPEWQGLSVGDLVRLRSGNHRRDLALEVAALDPERALVLVSPGHWASNFALGLPHATWAFVLERLGRRNTRLIVRLRADYRPDVLGRLLNHYLLEPVHFLMERRMLLGIKERAEAGAAPA